MVSSDCDLSLSVHRRCVRSGFGGSAVERGRTWCRWGEIRRSRRSSFDDVVALESTGIHACAGHHRVVRVRWRAGSGAGHPEGHT